MRRRDVLPVLAGIAICALDAQAPAVESVRRVGLLLIFSNGDPEADLRIAAFQGALNDCGWVQGKNLHVECRLAGGDFDRMVRFAKELMELGSEVIVTNALQPIIAVTQQTPRLPIVFAMVPDPVEGGLIGSLSNPENITGFTSFEYSIVGKWLELLKRIAPRVGRVGLIFNPDAYAHSLAREQAIWRLYWRQLEAVAPLLSVEPVAMPAHDLDEMERALVSLVRASDGALLMVPDPFTVGHYREIVASAMSHRLPACWPYRYLTTAGGLMSYGPDGAQVFRQAASYVDLILRGTKPRDLPIQRPTKLELVINLNTAKALGLDVPRTLLARAEQVIE
jgi:putative ABC transport system substrate-binding protein